MTSKIALTLAAISIVLSLFLLWENNRLKAEKSTASKLADVQEEHVHIIDYMIQLQYFANKIYFAGINQNKDLLAFYIHEAEEVMEDLEAHNLVKEGIGVSKNLRIFGRDPLELFEKSIENSPEDFRNHYLGWINQCNACHGVFKKEFIQITIPRHPVVSNQKF